MSLEPLKKYGVCACNKTCFGQICACNICIEILAQKIRQNPKITGIELPFSCEAKLSQFADDTTLIFKDTSSLHESMLVLGKFGDISGLKLNPMKVLGMYTSHNCDENNYLKFFLKKPKDGNQNKHLAMSRPDPHGKNLTL